VLRARVAGLSAMSEAYLANAHAAERPRTDIAPLLHEQQRATAGDRRDLIWTLARLAETPADTTTGEGVAA
jgi:hypothetical protein